MNKVEQLIQQHCPHGVEYKELGEIAVIGTGSKNTQDADFSGTYPFYVRSSQVRKIADYEFEEEAIIIPGEGGVGDIFHYVDGKYALHQRAYRICFKYEFIKTKFAYYYLVNHFKKFILMYAMTAAVISIRKPMIQKFPIPVPPLAVQEKIVRILDKFDALVHDLASGLPAEIKARRKQYEYYLEKVFDMDCEYVCIGDLGEFKKGYGISKSDFVDNGYPCIHYGEIGKLYKIFANEVLHKINKIDLEKLVIARQNDLLFTDCGMNVRDVFKVVAYKGIHDIAIGNHTYALEHNQDSKYLAYYFSSNQFAKLKKRFIYGIGTQVLHVNIDKLKKIKIPIPSLKQQAEIVKKLDSFYALSGDINSALQTELNLRKKQYAYYMNKLLSFKK